MASTRSYKQFKFNKEAKESLLAGVRTLADAVGATLGPLGNNVAIDAKWTYPQVIHDGVTVARSVKLEDRFEDVGAQIVKESAVKTNDIAGDGTTTATILAYSLISEGLKSIESGSNPMRLRRGIDYAIGEVVDYIESNAKKITTKEESVQVATISAQDEKIGQLVADTLEKIGKDGVTVVEEGTSFDISVDIQEGMQFDKGLLDTRFTTDDKGIKAEIKNPSILVTDHKLTSVNDAISIMETAMSKTKDIVVIADTIEGDALANFIANKVRGILNVLPVEAPGLGNNKKEMLKDIAALVGGNFIDKSTKKITSVMFEDFGQATKVEGTRDKTVIAGGKGDLGERVKELKELIKEESSSHDKERLRLRLARLTSGAAVIKAGATTEVEMLEKKERIIDSLSATKAALSDGVIPGGAVMLVRAIDEIKSNKEYEEGIRVVKTALVKPFMKLMENSGLDYLGNLNKVKEAKTEEGIDVMDGELKNLIDNGIIDPVKVVRGALQSALSVAGSVLTTSVIIVDIKEEKDE